MELKGKTALITGGARIGKTVAEALAERGCDLFLTYRTSRAAALESVKKAEETGVRAAAIQADLAVEKDVAAVIEEADRRFGRLDILINMASVYQKVPFARLDLQAWRKNLEVDLQASYLLSLRVVPLMRRHGGGRIINFSDWTAASGRPRYRDYTPYYVWKHATLGLTENLALELAPEILVNAIAPGPILPPSDMTPEENEKVLKETPLRRWGGAEEIAKAVLFLIESDFITGECLRVDGGRHLY
jgi:NAD(P)-dependent dehydrogenase (short-subunit alcohol dehydrogenase family)